MLLQRVFPNKDQSDRLLRFLRSRYGTQFYTLGSSPIHYLVRLEMIFSNKKPLILFFLRSSINVKLHNNVMHFLF
jgi:hypothetical protein